MSVHPEPANFIGLLHFVENVSVSIMQNNKYTMNAIVSASDIDGNYTATLLFLLGQSQNLAASHYGSGGLSIPHLFQKGMTWIIAKQRFEIAEYPLWLDNIAGTTWAKPVKGLFCNRDFSFSYQPDGKHASVNAAIGVSRKKIEQPQSPFLRGTTCWIILDNTAGRPVKPTQEMFGTLPFCDEDSLESNFPHFSLPQDFNPNNNPHHTETLFAPTILDIDMNDHVNNLNYVKWILSYTPLSIFRGKLVSAIDTYFVTSAKFGDELICKTAVISDEGANSECIHSIIRTRDGTEVFRARTFWRPAAEMARKMILD
jgi:acyl-ACP thioesterase